MPLLFDQYSKPSPLNLYLPRRIGRFIDRLPNNLDVLVSRLDGQKSIWHLTL